MLIFSNVSVTLLWRAKEPWQGRTLTPLNKFLHLRQVLVNLLLRFSRDLIDIHRPEKSNRFACFVKYQDLCLLLHFDFVVNYTDLYVFFCLLNVYYVVKYNKDPNFIPFCLLIMLSSTKTWNVSLLVIMLYVKYTDLIDRDPKSIVLLWFCEVPRSEIYLSACCMLDSVV